MTSIQTKRTETDFLKKVLRNGQDIFSQDWFKLLVLTTGMLSLILIKSHILFLQIPLRYFSIILIFLAGFWYGILGGLITALLCAGNISLEVLPLADLYGKGLTLHKNMMDILAFLVTGLTMGYLTEREKSLRKKLNEMAFYDELTGCLNYRLALELLDRQIKMSRRSSSEMSVIMLDIDYFKEINDSYGHLEGNKFLKWFADMIKKSIRTVDYVGRYGGDEFLILLPDCGKEQSLTILNRIRDNIMESTSFPAHLNREICSSMKFSAGIASFPSNGETVTELIHAADSSLYQAKKNGRDTYVMEKRRTVRFKYLTPLTIRLLDLSGQTKDLILQLKNISKSGMSFSTPDNITSSDFICRMDIPGSGSPIQLKCKIIHKNQEVDNLYHFGVHFTEKPVEFESSFYKLLENV